MTNIIISLIPIVIIFLILGIAVGITKLAKKGLPWNIKKRNPFTKDFLRGPGQSILKQVDDLKFDLLSLLLQLIILPLLVLIMPLINYALTNQKLSQFNIFLYGLILVAFLIFIFVRLYQKMKVYQQTQLGYEGEVAVGQELNQLMLRGFHVYHDFPADGFNIDHIVVGNTGAFAVETKARSKPTSDNRKNDARVEYDGKTLKFPHWVETKPIEQANRQAKWLKTWLSSAVGETVFVSPVLAIPGWFVKQTAAADTYIYNGKSPERLFPRVKHPSLNEQMIKRICHQLDAKCRDIEPKAYKENKK